MDDSFRRRLLIGTALTLGVLGTGVGIATAQSEPPTPTTGVPTTEAPADEVVPDDGATEGRDEHRRNCDKDDDGQRDDTEAKGADFT